MKTYPLHREFQFLNLGKTTCSSRVVHSLAASAEWLAKKLGTVKKHFRERFKKENVPPHLFSYLTTGTVLAVVKLTIRMSKGCLDTFPIRIRRVNKKLIRKSTQNGKYKAFVLKYQVACDLSGNVMWYSGPHAGCVGDPILWKNSHSDIDLHPLECLLADKIYGKGKNLIAPPKRKNNQPLDIDSRCINDLHTYYRVTIEHVIGFAKR